METRKVHDTHHTDYRSIQRSSSPACLPMYYIYISWPACSLLPPPPCLSRITAEGSTDGMGFYYSTATEGPGSGPCAGRAYLASNVWLFWLVVCLFCLFVCLFRGGGGGGGGDFQLLRDEAADNENVRCRVGAYLKQPPAGRLHICIHACMCVRMYVHGLARVGSRAVGGWMGT